MKPIGESDSVCDHDEACAKLADVETNLICSSKAYAALDNILEHLDFEPAASTPRDDLTEDPCCEEEQCHN